MLTWSTKRKAIYTSVAFAVVLIVIIIPLYFVLYEKPTCFDSERNGDEAGVDCGGSCQILCSFEVIDPIVVWSRAFRVAQNVYSAVAYVENPNINSQAVVSYEFKFYNDKNVLMATRSNTAFIPKNKVFAIFEPNIFIDNRTASSTAVSSSSATTSPLRVSFEFTGSPVWSKNLQASPELAVTKKILSGSDTKPRIDARIENRSSATERRVEVVGIVYDDKENAIGASRTFIDELFGGQGEDIVFTWPLPFETKEEICSLGGRGEGGGSPTPIGGIVAATSSPDVIGAGPEAIGVMLAIDRSGSMESDGKNPPQPLQAVKEAAVSFINNLDGIDQVGVVSFATTASEPPESVPTSDYTLAKQAVDNIAILRDGKTQYTNIGDAIEKAFTNLNTPDFTDLSERIIVLLTDGIATHPEKAGDKDFPLKYAIEKARIAKEQGALLYVIGLGDEVNVEFLQRIASVPEKYFGASSTAELEKIYEEIAVKICKNQPAVIEIIPRVIPTGSF